MGTVDAWAQILTERMTRQPWMATLLRWTGQKRESTQMTVEMTLRAMDAADVEIALLSAWCGSDGWLITNEEVKRQVDTAPDRFRGVASVDLRSPMDAVREVRRWAGEEGFVGVRALPWLWDLPPNDRRFYPVYSACVDVDVPFCTQVGHTGPLCRSEPGRPIPYLDDVLLDFPELTIVGGHVGFPWIDEIVSLALKYSNFYVDTSAYALHRLPPTFRAFMRGPGRSRVLFGTNWPMLSPERCLEGLGELDLSDEGREAFLSGNARRVYGLDAL
ncbi:MAG: amidohydrolase family protein [Thermoanaerobaculia bacterium]|nr:amidohydrolase family protein [Thermoanaerobaculia bacterium]